MEHDSRERDEAFLQALLKIQAGRSVNHAATSCGVHRKRLTDIYHWLLDTPHDKFDDPYRL